MLLVVVVMVMVVVMVVMVVVVVVRQGLMSNVGNRRRELIASRSRQPATLTARRLARESRHQNWVIHFARVFPASTLLPIGVNQVDRSALLL